MCNNSVNGRETEQEARSKHASCCCAYFTFVSGTVHTICKFKRKTGITYTQEERKVSPFLVLVSCLRYFISLVCDKAFRIIINKKLLVHTINFLDYDGYTPES